MPEVYPQSTTSPVIPSKDNQTPHVPDQKSTFFSGGPTNLFIVVLGAIIGFFVGGSFTNYFAQRGFLGDVGLEGGFYMVFPIPVFALLSVTAYKGIRSLNKRFKLFGYISFLIITCSLLSSAVLFYLDIKASKQELASIPSKVNFQIYKPTKNHPFNNLHETHELVSEDIELRCRGVEYTYYGSRLGPNLTEMKANELNCPEFNYFNQEEYDKALKSVKEGFSYGGKNENVLIREVGGGNTVLLISEYRNGKDRLYNIYGIKGGTLINISIGDCVLGDECEEKYIEFYKSLKPIRN